jgi:calcium/calmodulin-dependent protein kinase I
MSGMSGMQGMHSSSLPLSSRAIPGTAMSNTGPYSPIGPRMPVQGTQNMMGRNGNMAGNGGNGNGKRPSTIRRTDEASSMLWNTGGFFRQQAAHHHSNNGNNGNHGNNGNNGNQGYSGQPQYRPPSATGPQQQQQQQQQQQPQFHQSQAAVIPGSPARHHQPHVNVGGTGGSTPNAASSTSATSYYAQQTGGRSAGGPVAEPVSNRPRAISAAAASAARPGFPGISSTKANFRDRYIMERLLGDGTFAKVFQCRSAVNGHEYAAKIIDKRKWATNLEVMRNIQREIALLTELDHEHIIRFEEYFETDEEVIIITELVRGGDLLEKLISEGPMRERDAARVFKQICQAVAYIHERGIVHRDIKPENILSTSAAATDVKLCDFGQAARVRERDSIGSSAFGTYEYVAPEVIRRVPFDKPMDMWSLGVVLFILICGVFPFEGGQNDQVLFRKITAGKYKMPDRIARSVSNDVKDLIRSLLNVSPSQRATITDVLNHPWLRHA